MSSENKRKRKNIVAVIICWLALASCVSNEGGESKTASSGYFNLEAFVSEQISMLETQRPEVEKRLKLNGEEEVFLTREVNWEDDLAFFRLADISKPSLADSYVVEKKSSHTDLYRLKPGEQLPVEKLMVDYDPDSGEVKEVVVESVTENRLYDTVKKLRLTLDGEKGENRLVSYEISGYQQLRLGEKNRFEITGHVRKDVR